MSVKELASNPKVGVVVSAATAGAGIWTIFDWIPEDIGKIATIVGIILSVVLIYVHLRRGHLEIKKIKLETNILMHEYEVAQRAVQQEHGHQSFQKSNHSCHGKK